MADRPVKPIIILGAARSGTALVHKAIARHPDVAWLDEPNFVWKAYNGDVGHDMIPATRASEKVKAHVRRRFEEFRVASGKARLSEKTPQSAMRLPFVLEIFPDAKLVHVIRDGRQVVVSARRKYMGSVAKVTTRSDGEQRPEDRAQLGKIGWLLGIYRRKLGDGIPIRDLVHYGPKVWNMSLGILGLKKVFPWGPEFPGMRRMMRTHPLVDVCALQWQYCVEGVLNTLAHRRDVECYEVRFERLVDELDTVSREIFDFAELPQPGRLEPMAHQPFDPGKALRAFETELTPEEQAIVYERIGWTLERLGYELPRGR
jgi:hypothetical protein